jgi:hypothetical protein
MQIPPSGYYWFAGSLVAAVLLDIALFRVALEFLKPASAYLFWAARGAKLIALMGWMLFFNSYWYPQFLRPGAEPDALIKWGEAGLVLAIVAVAVATSPRMRRRHV